MGKRPKLIKKHDVRLLIHPGITESGVYDAVFVVNGNIVEREFEVDVNATYDYESDTNYYNLRDVTVTATCCNEDDEDIADIMERKLEEAIEDYMRGK
jgi:hypothetical protein